MVGLTEKTDQYYVRTHLFTRAGTFLNDGSNARSAYRAGGGALSIDARIERFVLSFSNLKATQASMWSMKGWKTLTIS